MKLENNFTKFFLIAVAFVVIYLLWKFLIILFDYPTYIVPSPELVSEKMLTLFRTGRIYPHLQTTLTEIFVGFSIGALAANIIGYILVKREWLNITITPYIVAFQAIPIVAMAPLFILWFGTGIASKIAVCALIVFFPIMINTVAAINAIDSNKRDLMKTYQANGWQVLTKLEIPASLPYAFSSLKIGLTLSVVGAIVGEFMGADQGLGFLINASLGLIDTPQLFAVIIILAIIGMSFYFFVSLVESLFKIS